MRGKPSPVGTARLPKELRRVPRQARTRGLEGAECAKWGGQRVGKEAEGTGEGILGMSTEAGGVLTGDSGGVHCGEINQDRSKRQILEQRRLWEVGCGL